MSHPEIDNQTPFAFEPLFLADEDGCPLLVTVVKGTFHIEERKSRIALADEQAPVNLAGQHWGEPASSSYKYEPETAFDKPATDIAMIGHAYPPRTGMTEMEVGLRIGPVEQRAIVFGDRRWIKRLEFVSMSNPAPLEPIPLVAERAFGGWDRSHADPEKHRFEPRNPVGTGYRCRGGKFEEGIGLPNIEHPGHRLKKYLDVVPPLGFGFSSPSWEPRCSLAGTYDASWAAERKPLLPEDFDRRFFNAAWPGLTAPGFLRGDESVTVLHAAPRPKVSFSLPAIPPPRLRVELNGREDQRLQTRLDTVIINMDEQRVFLLWRAHTRLRSGPPDVRAFEIQTA